MHDVVYVVGPENSTAPNDELRYSLRSLTNVDHGTVWIVGHKPDWCVNVEHLPTIQRRSKFQNSTANLLAACSHPDVSETFSYWNDDFFAVASTTVPVWHRGEIQPSRRRRRPQQFKRSSSYTDGKEATRQLLAHWGIDPSLDYELHVPMPVHKERMLEVVERARREWQITALNKRSLYGNYFEIGGEFARDVKVGNGKNTWRDGQVWVSTSDKSFASGAVGKRLREIFPAESPYEREAS